MNLWAAQSSDSLKVHGPSFLCPWNSPDKNTRVGSNSLLQGIFLTQGLNLGLLHWRQILYLLSHQGNESESESRSVLSSSLRLYSPWKSPGQNTGVGSLSLLQGIFPTQGSNPGLPHCRWILYQQSQKGRPRTAFVPFLT